MNKHKLEQKKLLETQLKWAKEQDRLLEMMEDKLFQMRDIAEYARDHSLSVDENERLTSQLDVLKKEVLFLEKQLQSVIH